MWPCALTRQYLKFSRWADLGKGSQWHCVKAWQEAVPSLRGNIIVPYNLFMCGCRCRTHHVVYVMNPITYSIFINLTFCWSVSNSMHTWEERLENRRILISWGKIIQKDISVTVNSVISNTTVSAIDHKHKKSKDTWVPNRPWYLFLFQCSEMVPAKLILHAYNDFITSTC
jgi:hypothetical protein